MQDNDEHQGLALLRSLIASIPDIVFYKDCQGRYLGANAAFAAYIGLPEKYIIGKTDLDLLPKETAEFYRSKDQEVLSSNKARRNEEWIGYPDGRRVLLETLKSPITGPDGVVVGIVGLSRDITAARSMETRLNYRMRFQALLARLSRNLINPVAGIDDGIDKALKETGEFVGVDRVYVFLIKPGRELMDNTHEWCAPGVDAQINNLQNVPTNVFPWWMTLLANGETIRVPLVTAMSDVAGAERAILEAQGIQSVLVIPLAQHGELSGFLGFDVVRASRVWDDDSVELLRFVGDIVVNAIQQKCVRNEPADASGRRIPLVTAEAIALTAKSDSSSQARWLPREVRVALRDAITQGNSAEVGLHIRTCANTFPMMARQLKYLHEHHAYERMLEILAIGENPAN